VRLEACEVVAPNSAEAVTGFVVCDVADAEAEPNEAEAEARFVICVVAVATTVPKLELPVAFIGNGEPSKPTVASFNALVFKVKRENAMMP
jgi:hypothetical protein